MTVPSAELQNEFSKKILPTLASIDTLMLQNAELAKARDLLLPRLIDGRISVDV
jgi:type I restriction enzyme S subunit